MANKKRAVSKAAQKVEQEVQKIMDKVAVERDAWKKEALNLRKQLDNRADTYNNAGQLAAPRPFLSDEPKQKITSTLHLVRFVDEVYQKGLAIIDKKNRDYGDHLNNDPFGNFRRHDLKGFLVRIDDKLARLNTFADSGRLAVLDESVLDSIIDACNYLGIMAAYIYSEKQKSFDQTFNLTTESHKNY